MESIKINNNTYYIDKELKPGSQKKIFLCHDSNDEKVIVKTVSFNQLFEVERVYREVVLLEGANSIFLPKIIEHHLSVEDKKYYIVEEYIKGQDLLKNKTYFDSEDKIIQLIYDISVGLKPIWDQDIVHRDIKPEHIFIREESVKPVIIDFGIARFAGKDSITRLENSPIPHTKNYAAPEILKGENDLISIRTDFFNLGIIAYELLTGRHPFDCNNNTIEENIKIGSHSVVEGSLAFKKFILKLIASLPFKRFKNADSIMDFIKAYWEVQ